MKVSERSWRIIAVDGEGGDAHPQAGKQERLAQEAREWADIDHL
jgi:hypothetical protein